MTQTKRERLFSQATRGTDVTLKTGDVVQVRPLSLIERARLVKACMVDGEVDNEKLIPEVVIACTYDGDDKLFTVGDRETIEALPATEIDPLWETAARLNGFSADAAKDAEKN